MSTDQDIKQFIKESVKAVSAEKIKTLQSLWGGYGTIDRYTVKGADIDRVIVKHIYPPQQRDHPRGWNTDFGHQRKLRSYQFETRWYLDWALFCDDLCRVPRCLAVKQDVTETILILEDLDQAGFGRRPTNIDLDAMHVCLRWMANFHITFLGRDPKGLWPTGTYWHLETRPEEFDQLDDRALKASAKQIDQILKTCPYQSIVHGDAKLANFCFSGDLRKVAAVDFQYVGGGVGVKDVAYFIGSCLHDLDCEHHEKSLLDVYFLALKNAYQKRTDLPNAEFHKLEKSWRDLYAFAWTDFHRFLKGWSPGHWKIHSYSERLAKKVVDKITEENNN